MSGPPCEHLVDVTWLAAHGKDQDVVLLQVDSDSTSYYAAHLPGALPIDWADELHEPVRRAPVGQAGFEALLQRKGITADTHVVLYGMTSALAAHAYWLFRYYGHERVSLLDGGCAAWIRAGHPLTDEVPPVPAVPPYRSPGPDHELRVSRDQLLERYVGAPPGTVVLDCRGPQEFAGHAGHPMDLPVDQHRVGGHVPGAVNVPSSRVLDQEGRFVSRPRLVEVFAGAGVATESDVVVYCRVAEDSALLWFALHELLEHRRVRHYYGGWTEYGSLVDVPVERGGPVITVRS